MNRPVRFSTLRLLRGTQAFCLAGGLLFASIAKANDAKAGQNKPNFPLSIRVEPGLAAKVVWPGGEKECAPPQDAPECRYMIPLGTQVKITAAAAGGKPFDEALKPEFDGACANQGGLPPYRCDLYMYVPKNVIVRNAVASLGKFTFTPSAGGSISSPEMQLWCSGGKSCEYTMTVGLAVRFGRVFRISARPDPKFRFVGWTGECAQEKTDTCTIATNRPRDLAIGAQFEPMQVPVVSK